MRDARLSRLAEAVARTSLSPVAQHRLALRAGTGSRTPGRAAGQCPVGAVVAVTALAAAFTFGTSLDHLLGSPRQQGWNWDVLVGNPNSTTDQVAQGSALLARNPVVASYSAIAILAGAQQGNVVIDGKVVDLLLAFDPLKGSVYPPLVQGHVPRAGDEVVLASKTLQSCIEASVSPSTLAGPAGKPRILHIVGSMISPSVGDLFTNGLGDGGWVYGPAVRRQLVDTASGPPAAPRPRCSRSSRCVTPTGCRRRLRTRACAEISGPPSCGHCRPRTSSTSRASTAYRPCSPPWSCSWGWRPSVTPWWRRSVSGAGSSPS